MCCRHRTSASPATCFAYQWPHRSKGAARFPRSPPPAEGAAP
ncbi:hypothetical protein I545_2868 [Mycobacterium kansasii 662]|uniref:Uncharacterized protein n=1 Tax=Mycobacterium kansasii 662 TaxID=1299326 RepID=X7ZHU4_MYCKA|nr:hypothetical protein I547_4833 [Mycobacterium kansasii 824]EUA18621.1 hypothetical protein I545_2868 [Mycobacterium kansasii 662]KEP41207.1 hypothetical protein MKSMC1_36280 [Mycobacterium kansasii]